MTLDQMLRDYLETSGESMRALSLRAGLNPKAVSDILNIPGLRPRHATLAALSTATGRDLFASQPGSRVTFADMIKVAQENGNGVLASRLRWLCRNAGLGAGAAPSVQARFNRLLRSQRAGSLWALSRQLRHIPFHARKGGRSEPTAPAKTAHR